MKNNSSSHVRYKTKKKTINVCGQVQMVDKNKYGPSLPLLSFESSVPSRQITSSKLTIETLEQDVKYVQS